MDRPGLDDEIKFAGGIFSGSVLEVKKQEQGPESDGGYFFNYATLPQKNQEKIAFKGPDSMGGQEKSWEERQNFTQFGTKEQEAYQISGQGHPETGRYQETGDSQGYAGSPESGIYQGYTGSPESGIYQGYTGHQETGGYQGYTGSQKAGAYKGYAKPKEPGGFQGCGEYQGNRASQGYESYQAAYWKRNGYGKESGIPAQYNCNNGGGRGSHNCTNCPNRGRRGHSAVVIMTIVAVVIMVIVAMAALTVAFLAVILCLVKISSYQGIQPGGATEGAGNYYYEGQKPSWGDDGGWYGDNPEPYDEGDYYGEVTDAIREDLDYSIAWENYEYEGNNDSVMIAVDYPVILGTIPNLDAINDIIDDEAEYFEKYYEEYSKYMMPDESFMVYSEGYVTYMDDEVMSVVFAEMVYTDYWTDYGLYCLNIDVENGVVLDNKSIMKIDDEFAVDFRKRCKQQNGMVEDLEYMSDQEIASYLSEEGTSIMFYTPMGMEIGLNMGEYYVTVTYKDYEKFLQRY